MPKSGPRARSRENLDILDICKFIHNINSLIIRILGVLVKKGYCAPKRLRNTELDYLSTMIETPVNLIF
jgi:hypothetical protein